MSLVSTACLLAQSREAKGAPTAQQQLTCSGGGQPAGLQLWHTMTSPVVARPTKATIRGHLGSNVCTQGPNAECSQALMSLAAVGRTLAGGSQLSSVPLLFRDTAIHRLKGAGGG